jgi:hypothetical protein
MPYGTVTLIRSRHINGARVLLHHLPCSTPAVLDNMLYAWLTLLSIAAANGALAFGARGTQNPFTGDFAGVPAFTKAFDKIKNSPIAPASQYNVDFTGAAYDDGLFTPSVESLSALSPDTFTRLEHPAYPHYSVRVKKSKFCDTGANAYTGYIDIEAKHIFFYFVCHFHTAQVTKSSVDLQSSLRVGVILTRTTSFSGQTAALDAPVPLDFSWNLVCVLERMTITLLSCYRTVPGVGRERDSL